MTRIDELDEKIIAVLTQDARTSIREVARIIGVSDTGVRKRLKRLKQAGAAKVTAVVNHLSLGLSVSAFVRLQTAPSVARSVAEAAAELSFVSVVALTAGRYNVVALVVAESQSALTELIHDHFRRFDGVHTIDVAPLVSTAKHRLDLILIQ